MFNNIFAINQTIIINVMELKENLSDSRSPKEVLQDVKLCSCCMFAYFIMLFCMKFLYSWIYLLNKPKVFKNISKENDKNYSDFLTSIQFSGKIRKTTYSKIWFE